MTLEQWEQIKDGIAQQCGYQSWTELEYDKLKSERDKLAEENERLKAQKEEYGRLCWNRACEEQRKICSNIATYNHVPEDWGINGRSTEILNAPKPEFKP